MSKKNLSSELFDKIMFKNTHSGEGALLYVFQKAAIEKIYYFNFVICCGEIIKHEILEEEIHYTDNEHFLNEKSLC